MGQKNRGQILATILAISILLIGFQNCIEQGELSPNSKTTQLSNGDSSLSAESSGGNGPEYVTTLANFNPALDFGSVTGGIFKYLLYLYV